MATRAFFQVFFTRVLRVVLVGKLHWLPRVLLSYHCHILTATVEEDCCSASPEMAKDVWSQAQKKSGSVLTQQSDVRRDSVPWGPE